MECFKNGDHTGHDYRIHSAGGGMCDCGDPQAWKKEGFCTKHAGASEFYDAEEILPKASAQGIKLTLRAVLSLMV